MPTLGEFRRRSRHPDSGCPGATTLLKTGHNARASSRCNDPPETGTQPPFPAGLFNCLTYIDASFNLSRMADGISPGNPEIVPVLPLREDLVFPLQTKHLFIGRKGSQEAIKQAEAAGRKIFLVPQKNFKEGELAA